MIKAYHCVPGKFMNDVLDDGVLLPASERLTRGDYQRECRNGYLTYVSQAKNPDPLAAEALWSLIEERLDLLRPGKATGVQSSFLTSDVLAGDMDCIFLAPFDWYGLCGEYGSGFVFDAEKLIRSGAGLREDDIARYYRYAILDVLESRWHLQVHAEKALLRDLYEVKAQRELRGKAALAALEVLDREWRGRVAKGKRTGKPVALLNAEMTWCGRLNIDDAIEIWKDEKRIR
jgi:hypothetical protein